ncbi:hypothetical protein [Escherichia phage P13374]|uniref:Uncharacterized protein n=6 Tax=root TaxID=1 RepID=A0A160RJZ0_ECOLX|nr:hypothetical protein D300_gp35 [Escherichia phage P13374]CDK12663.1 hypothetical protein [Escherichia phage P13803]CDK23970.1 hypothetical protein [Escherichia phage P14437]CDL18819.1 hypothetical protein [Escherichia phage P13771]CDL18898.1 hypothetical protein [Escherichia phage P8983]CDO68032.1 hypothetical protein [Escherichia coli]
MSGMVGEVTGLTRSLFGNFDLTILKYPVACGAFLPSDA